jgi:DNA-binding CsgD family transcriptional regulator
LVAAAAEERPVVSVIDDAQWLDQESLAVLAFVARRLYAEGIAMFFAVREPDERPVLLDGLPDLRLSGLPTGAAKELVSSVAGGGVDEQVGARIVAETGANPLALIELVGELAPDQLAGQALLPHPLPIGRQLEVRFLSRVRHLPSDTQMLLLLAAADPTGDLDLLWRAGNHLGISLEMAAAEERGLLALGPPVSFRHPLIRSAIYYGASLPDRRLAHAALAEATNPDLEADRGAWHRAASTARPSERVARQLEDAAERARRRGGYAAAGAFLARAAALTPKARPRVRRLLAAARAECTAGAVTTARALLDEAGVDLEDPYERGLAQRVAGDIHVALDQPAEAAEVLLAAAREFAGVDVGLARDTLMDALLATAASTRFSVAGADAVDVARTVRAISHASAGTPNAGDLLLDAFAAYFLDGPISASPLMRRALDALDQQDDQTGPPSLLNWLRAGSWIAGAMSDDEAFHSIADRAVGRARAQGAMVPLSKALVLLGTSHLLEGNFDAASEAYDERSAIEQARGGFCATGQLVVSAWRGDERAVRSRAPVVAEEVREKRLGWKASWVEYALSILDLGLGRYRDALTAVTGAYEENPALAAVAWPDLIEAAARCGETVLANELLAQRAPPSLSALTPLAAGLLARSRALLADDSEAESLYLEAIGHLGTCRGPIHLARTHLLYGEWLRRAKRRRDARRELQTAYELFDGIGARAFAERARRELTAAGATARRRAAAAGLHLTPQEGHVARLAAVGATNAEIGAQMFISPNTVDYHLRKVFQKLGVSSRRQLHNLQFEDA